MIISKHFEEFSLEFFLCFWFVWMIVILQVLLRQNHISATDVDIVGFSELLIVKVPVVISLRAHEVFAILPKHIFVYRRVSW